MYPVLFQVGGFQVTSFGALVALAFVVGGFLLRAELERRGHGSDHAWSMITAAIVGGVIGGRLYYLLLYWPTTAADPWLALTARGGLVWYGGFVGGVIAVRWYVWLPALVVADAAAPAVTLGYAIGRLGCFLVGDDYGRPTEGPWGVAFPEGLPPSTAGMLRTRFGVEIPADVSDTTLMAVHPTQLYEALLMTAAFGLLWRLRRRGWPDGVLFSVYLTLAGAERLVVELFRAKDDRFFGVLTLAQLISLTAVTVGVGMIVWLNRERNGVTV